MLPAAPEHLAGVGACESLALFTARQMQPLAAVDRVGQCGSCGAPLRAEEVALHRIDPHSDAADELLCAACAPAPLGPFPPGTGPAAEPEPEPEPESLAQLMTLLEGSGQLPHQLEATKGMLQQMGEDASAIDADIATVTARIARAEAAQGDPVT